MSVLSAVAATVLSTSIEAQPVKRWQDVEQPAPGASRIIGSYTAGCIQGAQALPSDGPGFRTMRRNRRRFFGHLTLVTYMQELGRQVAEQGLGILNIGDLGQARGGPTLSGHRSHQTGLDANIWFWLSEDAEPLDAASRQAISASSMLTADRRALSPQFWTSRQVRLLQTAVGFEAVERIFVNPLIKQALCQQFPGAPWLRKVRPWWGHHAHFHVRLRCPPGATACVKQTPPPAGDGCDATLAWWFSDAAQQPPRKDTGAIRLPAACQAVLSSTSED